MARPPAYRHGGTALGSRGPRDQGSDVGRGGLPDVAGVGGAGGVGVAVRAQGLAALARPPDLGATALGEVRPDESHHRVALVGFAGTAASDHTGARAGGWGRRRGLGLLRRLRGGGVLL